MRRVHLDKDGSTDLHFFKSVTVINTTPTAGLGASVFVDDASGAVFVFMAETGGPVITPMVAQLLVDEHRKRA